MKTIRHTHKPVVRFRCWSRKGYAAFASHYRATASQRDGTFTLQTESGSNNPIQFIYDY